MSIIDTKKLNRQPTVNVYCTNTNKTVVAELIKLEKDRIIVILPGFQKLILIKTTKPNFYTTTLFGMEFTCNTQDK